MDVLGSYSDQSVHLPPSKMKLSPLFTTATPYSSAILSLWFLGVPACASLAFTSSACALEYVTFVAYS